MAQSDRAAEIRGNLAARRQRSSERLLKDLAEALLRDRAQPQLAKEQARGGIPAGRGTARQDYQPGSSKGSGGIASPLTEKKGTEEDPSASFREYFTDTANLYSSDFMLAVEIQPLKKMVMLDNDGAEVVFNYELPDTI